MRGLPPLYGTLSHLYTGKRGHLGSASENRNWGIRVNYNSGMGCESSGGQQSMAA